MEKLWSPLGCPVGGLILRKNAKTTEKTMTVDSGFRSDHVQPKADRLYRPRSSRSTRLSVSSRASAYSANRVIGFQLQPWGPSGRITTPRLAGRSRYGTKASHHRAMRARRVALIGVSPMTPEPA